MQQFVLFLWGKSPEASPRSGREQVPEFHTGGRIQWRNVWKTGGWKMEAILVAAFSFLIFAPEFCSC